MFNRGKFVCIFRSVLQPLITSVTLMSLTSLSGLLNITFLLRSNFRLGSLSSQQADQIVASDFHLMDMGYIVAGANVLAPLITCIFVQRFGQKRFMLFSAGLMAASLLFLTLLAHFQDGRLIEFIGTSPAFGWTVQTAIVAFLIGHQIGAGCFSWLFCGELCTKKSGNIGENSYITSAHFWPFLISDQPTHPTSA